MKRKQVKKGTIKRLFKTIRGFYPVMLPVVMVCIVFSAAVSSIPAIFMQNVIALVENSWQSGVWSDVGPKILKLVSLLAGFYVLALISSITYNQLMAVMTQGTLKKLREKMFNGMQWLPIQYFDTNNHGDIMSYYTNDIDTLRQMISQSFPQLMITAVTILSIFCIMIYYSLWMTLVVLSGVAVIYLITKKVGGGSAKYFFRQQEALGKVEGFAEEMMNGQKVIKVFCHERASETAFDALNQTLFEQAERAILRGDMEVIEIQSGIGNRQLSAPGIVERIV